MAGLMDNLAAGLRLAGGTVSPRVFQQIGQEEELKQQLVQRAQELGLQRELQRERMTMENAARQQAQALELFKFQEGVKAKWEEGRQRHIEKLDELTSRNASMEERAAAERSFREWQTRFMADSREGITRLAAALRPPPPEQPLVTIPDANSPTGFRYVQRGAAIDQPAPAPPGSPEKKLVQPLSSAELQKWQDREGNHPPPGTSMSDLEKPGSPYKVMTTAQLAMNAKFKSAQAAIDKMDSLVNEIWDPEDTAEGPAARTRNLVKFKTQRLTQSNSAVAQYDAFSRGTIAALVRAAGEVGNLNEWEQQRALKMIPAEGDTAPVARAKMANLEDWLYNASKGAIGAPAFATEADAEKAAKAGRIKPGDKIRVKGQKGTWK